MESNSAASLIGDAVHVALARGRVSQHRLASALGISQAAVSRRVRGVVNFSAPELLVVASLTGTPVGDLYPALDAEGGAAA